MEEKKFTNRLIKEKSPYLLQHAHNPVDWYPWGEEAFNAAQKQDKPIFLSIGYATCHWCHIMENDCFANPEIASKMNKACINVKVDREELPEVDALYMEFAQTLMVGAAGWPLNIILTPDLEPFFAMTYVPPESSPGFMGMKQMIEQIEDIWCSDERDSVIEQSKNIVEAFEETVHTHGHELPDGIHVVNAAELIYKLADPVFGGVKGVPKFPIPCQMIFMLRYVYQSLDARALFFVEKTLDMIQRGGLRDHIGGGFSRYSVDEQWHIPHFEKMLYDNALLVRVYLETWQMTKKSLFKDVAIEILDYLLRDMRHEDGGFLCAEDSDSEGIEGKFYTWTEEQIKDVLGPIEGNQFCEFFGVKKEGNFHGSNVLHISEPYVEFAEKRSLDAEHLELSIREQRQRLYANREKRIPPFKDDKILSAWNGVMIYALAEAGAILENDAYIEAAQKAAHFVKKNMWHDGLLLRRWRDGEARFSAVFDDYAFMIHGLLKLFEVDGDAGWLAWAMQMARIIDMDFRVPDGAYYTTDGRDPYILIKRCEFVDGVLPAGNAVHCENLMKLYQLTSQESYLVHAENILKAVKIFLEGYTPSFAYHLIAFQRYLDPKSSELVIALNEKEEYKKEIQKVLAETYIPHCFVVWRKEDDEHLFECLPYVRLQKPLGGKTTIYIRYKDKCYIPKTDIIDIVTTIKKL